MADNPNLKAQIEALVPDIISQEVEFMAQENGFRQFRNFVVVKEDFNKFPGDTLSIPKIADLPPAQNLSETSVLRGSGKKLSIGSVSITPTEKGDEVQYTEYSARVSQQELQDIVVELLARQSSKKENLDLRDTFFDKGTRTRYAASKASQSAVADKLSYTDVDYVVEELEAAEAMKFNSGGLEHFVGFIHPYARTALIDGLRSTSDYANAVPQLYAGEIGMYNRVRFIESAYCPFRVFIKTAMAKTGGVTLEGASDDARLALSDQYCASEDWTITYVHATTTWTVSGSVSGAHKVVAAGVEAASFTSAQLAAGDIIVQGSGIDQVKRTESSPFIIKTGALAGTADGTATFTSQRNICTKIVAQRHVALGAIKPVTMLGVESFDYGRTIGIAWNAFYDSIILNDEYGWVIESKR